MGWTTTHRHDWESEDDIIRRVFSGTNEHGRWEVLDLAWVGTTAYLAVRRTLPGGEEYVFAGVALTARYAKDHYNFGYKDMDESVGPSAADCPARILKALSPLDPADPKNRSAIDWRARCQANLDRRNALRRLKHGQVMFLPGGALFKGSDERQHYFVVQKLGSRRFFYALGAGFHCRLRGATARELEPVNDFPSLPATTDFATLNSDPSVEIVPVLVPDRSLPRTGGFQRLWIRRHGGLQILGVGGGDASPPAPWPRTHEGVRV